MFRQKTDDRARTVDDKGYRLVGKMAGLWQVSFEQRRDAPDTIAMPQLTPLNEHDDFAVRHFSGVASYTTHFNRPVHKGRPLWVDPGQIGDVAQLLVNGQLAGTSWWAPNRVEVGRLLVDGSNTLKVRVANLWVNRLIGDQQFDLTKVTFTAVPTYKADTPLRPAGLIGPVSAV